MQPFLSTVKWKVAYIAISLAAFTSFNATAQSEDALEGASSVIQALMPDNSANESTATDRPAALLASLQAYRKVRDSLTSQGRADQWIQMAFSMADWEQTDLLQSYGSLDPETGKPVSFESLLRALPPPADWQALWQAFQAYDSSAVPDQFVAGLRLLVAGLVPSDGRLEEAVTEFRRLANDATDVRTKLTLQSLLSPLETTVAMQSGDIQHLLKVVETEAQSSEPSSSSVEIPDVITILGPDKGKEWLHNILTTARISIAVPVGEETKRMARRIALERVDDLEVAHWGLITDFESIPVYEALLARFPSSTASIMESYGVRRQAQTYYLLSLIGANRVDDATQQIRALARQGGFSLTAEMLQNLESAGYSKQTQAFLQALLKDDPSIEVWGPYFKLSARVGLAEQASAFVKELIDSDRNTEGVPADLKARYAEALLALNEVEAALTIFDATIESADAHTRSDLGLKVGKLGLIMNRSDLVDQGFQIVQTALEKTRGQEDAYWRRSAIDSFITLARDTRRFGSAEAFLRSEMAYLQDYLAKYAKLVGTSSEVLSPHYLKPLAVEIAGVYGAAGSWSDVITWIDGFPYWGVADAASLLQEKDGAKDPLGIHLAQALVESNKHDQARTVLTALLRTVPEDDRVYALYSKINGESAIEDYDKLFAVDPFEERPMIWKANALLASGDVESARNTIELAISVDPSDGEQGPEDRMRAYSVYADVLEAQGAHDKAKSMRQAVAAIRLAEEADRYFDAGLYTTAIEMYEQAAQQFDSAYCVQSRLAIQLTERGRFQDAIPHYKRAYSLMPDSFGRVESHCFRCENVFEDVRAQGIADDVFSDMLSAEDNNAKTQYMMGYLRKEQGKYTEALSYFREAVGTDPLYLNAWKQIANIGQKTHLEAWEINTVALKIRALDPLRRHSKIDYSQITDLAELWNISAAIYRQYGEELDSVYRLPGSSTFIEQAEGNEEGAANLVNYMNAFVQNDTQIPHPGIEIAQTKLVETALQTMFVGWSNFF